MSNTILFTENHTLLIAEIGSNHGGDAGLARESIAVAKEAGADAIKFQMYEADRLVDNKMPVLKYINQSHATQRERFHSLQLGKEVFLELAAEAKSIGIKFLCTPFYEDAVEFLNPLVPAFKIASGDLTNQRLLKAVIATEKTIILSTGLSTPEEISWAVNFIPNDRLHLLHCVGAYPTPDDQVNLMTIPMLEKEYGLPVGYSDHSVGTTACIAAVTLGATIIEKHFLPRKGIQVADKALSISIEEFKVMATEIRRIEKMRGEQKKCLQADEQYFRKTLRRSIYATEDICAGQPIRSDQIIPLRPWLADAVSPMELEHITGRVTKRAIKAGEPILLDYLDN